MMKVGSKKVKVWIPKDEKNRSGISANKKQAAPKRGPSNESIS
jgi:hypothetical protein